MRSTNRRVMRRKYSGGRSYALSRMGVMQATTASSCQEVSTPSVSQVHPLWRMRCWLEECKQRIDEEEIEWWLLIHPLMDGSDAAAYTLVQRLLVTWCWTVKTIRPLICMPTLTILNIGQFLVEDVKEHGWGIQEWLEVYTHALQRVATWSHTAPMHSQNTEPVWGGKDMGAAGSGGGGGVTTMRMELRMSCILMKTQKGAPMRVTMKIVIPHQMILGIEEGARSIHPYFKAQVPPDTHQKNVCTPTPLAGQISASLKAWRRRGPQRVRGPPRVTVTVMVMWTMKMQVRSCWRCHRQSHRNQWCPWQVSPQLQGLSIGLPWRQNWLTMLA